MVQMSILHFSHFRTALRSSEAERDDSNDRTENTRAEQLLAATSLVAAPCGAAHDCLQRSLPQLLGEGLRSAPTGPHQPGAHPERNGVVLVILQLPSNPTQRHTA